MSQAPTGIAYPSRCGVVGWILFDVASQPVFTLITTFVFAPFFASRIADNAVNGQTLWGLAAGLSGFFIAMLSPVLGSMADASGGRKPWIGAFSILVVVGSAMLWAAVPGSHYAVPIALIGFACATIGAEFATVFTNAMMPSLAPPERLGRLSGYGWAAGYAGGLAALAFMLAFLVADAASGRTILGLTPLFGLDPATGEGDRAAGPLSAIWYAVFILPLFFWTPDTPRLIGLRAALGTGLRDLRGTLLSLQQHRNVALFLLSKMIYIDGLAALFAFGGIYAAGTFGWSAIEIGIFGILLTVSGTAGAMLGGLLDDRLGSKRVILGALVVLFLACIGILATTGERIFFVIPVEPPQPNGDLFAATSEQIYIVLGLVIGAVAGPLQAASRTLLAHLAPPAHMTQFFGLYALSGKVTTFLGPLAVSTVTALTQSQRGGMAVLLVFFAIGAVLLAAVRPPQRT